MTTQKLPKHRIGIILASIYPLFAFIDLGLQDGENVRQSWSLYLLTLIYIFYIYQVAQLHLFLKVRTNSDYPISPNRSIWLNIIPFYNLYGIIKWTNTIADYINDNSEAVRMKRGSAAVIMIILMITAFIPIPLGDMIVFQFFNVFGLLFYYLLFNNMVKKIRIICLNGANSPTTYGTSLLMYWSNKYYNRGIKFYVIYIFVLYSIVLIFYFLRSYIIENVVVSEIQYMVIKITTLISYVIIPVSWYIISLKRGIVSKLPKVVLSLGLLVILAYSYHMLIQYILIGSSITLSEEAFKLILLSKGYLFKLSMVINIVITLIIIIRSFKYQ